MRLPRSKPASPASTPLDEDQENLIGEVFRIYGGWTGPALSHLTHKPGSPWDQVYDDRGWGIAIPERIIKDYYEQRAAAAQ
jgi:uncharacterized phage-associated protein